MYIVTPFFYSNRGELYLTKFFFFFFFFTDPWLKKSKTRSKNKEKKKKKKKKKDSDKDVDAQFDKALAAVGLLKKNKNNSLASADNDTFNNTSKFCFKSFA